MSEVTVKVRREHVPHVRDDLITTRLHGGVEDLIRVINGYHDPSSPPLKLNGEHPYPPAALREAREELARIEALIAQLGWNPEEDTDCELRAPATFLRKMAISGVTAGGEAVNNRAPSWDEDPIDRERVRWYMGEVEAFMSILEQLDEGGR